MIEIKGEMSSYGSKFTVDGGAFDRGDAKDGCGTMPKDEKKTGGKKWEAVVRLGRRGKLTD